MTKRITTEFQTLSKKPLPGITVSLHDDQIRIWDIIIEGPPGSPYEGGRFHAQIHLPETYPHERPEIAFKTKIYSPAIAEEKGVWVTCVPALREWRASAKVSDVLKQFYERLVTPSGELNGEVAAVLQKEPAKFNETAREWTRLYAMF